MRRPRICSPARDLLADLARYDGRVNVAVGAGHDHDARGLREDAPAPRGARLQIVPRAGHAGYIEAPAAYTAIIDTFCRASDSH